MAVSKRGRHTVQQRIAIAFGAALLLIVIIALVGSVIQGSRRPATESAMQRVISASTRVNQYYFIGDEFSVEDGTLYVKGHYAGTPLDVPETDEEWQTITEEVAKIYAREIRGLADTVSVENYYKGELVAKVVIPVN